jgi:hypothetical protein
MVLTSRSTGNCGRQADPGSSDTTPSCIFLMLNTGLAEQLPKPARTSPSPLPRSESGCSESRPGCGERGFTGVTVNPGRRSLRSLCHGLASPAPSGTKSSAGREFQAPLPADSFFAKITLLKGTKASPSASAVQGRRAERRLLLGQVAQPRNHM